MILCCSHSWKPQILGPRLRTSLRSPAAVPESFAQLIKIRNGLVHANILNILGLSVRPQVEQSVSVDLVSQACHYEM